MKSVEGSLKSAAITAGISSTVTEDRSHHLTSGLSAAIIANVLWGTSFLASKYTLAVWGPFTASALRFLIATVLMFAGLKLFRRKIQTPQAKQWIYVLAISLSGFGFLYPLQLSGMKLISSGMSAAIMLTSPLFVVIAGNLLLKERFTARKLTAIALGITGGTILLSGKGGFSVGVSNDFILGSILTLAASVSLALSVIATRKIAGKLNTGSITFWSMLLGFGFLAISAIVFEKVNLFETLLSGTPSSWSALLFLALICSAFCFFIWNFALSKASPKEIASTMHLKTPTAVLLGAVVVNEQISSTLVVGTAIVMFGVWLSQTSPKGGRV